MNIDTLIDCLTDNLEPIPELIQARKLSQSLDLRRSAHLPILAAIRNKLNLPILLITDRSDRALMLFEELKFWAPKVDLLYFPEPEPLFYENAAWSELTRQDRLKVLDTLVKLNYSDGDCISSSPIIIAPARSLMVKTLPKSEYIRNVKILKTGLTIHLDELVRHCLLLGYSATNIVVSPGQYARRGGIIDIWVPAGPLPARIEFYGNEVETIRYFNPATQRTEKDSVGKKNQILRITPAREFICPPSDDFYSNNSECSEFVLPLVHQDAESIFEYLPQKGLVFLDDPQAIMDACFEIEEQAVAIREENIETGILANDFPVPYIGWSEIQDLMSFYNTIILGASSIIEIQSLSDNEHQVDNQIKTFSDKFTPNQRFGGRLKTMMEYILEKNKEGDMLVIVSRQCARLEGLWSEYHTNRNNKPAFIEGSLTEGWTFTHSDCPRIQLLTDGEIFGWRRPEIRQRAHPIAEPPESTYANLTKGDWVVHIDHGIGRYKGLVERTVEGLEREYLCIEYADESNLFVPVYQADRVTKYIGPDSRKPNPSRLGGTEWQTTKATVKDAVKKVAEDLLTLYAKRNTVNGFAFSEDSPWQHELEASFPYIETKDQIRVLEEVKTDMQTARPMDRLVCGDVGYGKTEVALRAAFKAVLDGKQVAILVPTTILAQQHYNTFKQRLSAYPVEVEMLSRFRTISQQREILSKLKSGFVDIVIGTHRLLSQDVSFKDLGLLIIDEEQRFGVTHKETLKKMRTEVDVLTLTATPIPRTLYMALSGIRDISTINTPPEERLPITTHVGPYSKHIVRQAVLRELERGGQVFFVHNRVQTIGAVENHLRKTIPEARIGIAHGQMQEEELSKRMQQFSDGEIDILLSTSIIESGLDIPNANTLIVDRADTFGLSQLYQLRGRVGRGAQRAYAYFFRHSRKPVSGEGRLRLETIAENTQLGAGISIAMRDLEIRGAGDILGIRQHGHIAAVGFNLYTRLLADAVRRIRTGRDIPPNLENTIQETRIFSSNVDLPLPISIPEDYVPDKTVRLGLYRRLAELRSINDAEVMREEFIDRFGAPPELVKNLFFQIEIKLISEQIGFSSITTENGQIVMRFPDNEVPENLPELGNRVRVGKTALWMPYDTKMDWQHVLQQTLLLIGKTHTHNYH
ncbi:MAG: transcription-repair coupling factor [Anaerolineales bacterium]|jgi:transcription-repair coupling factor (superfamily II helicase)